MSPWILLAMFGVAILYILFSSPKPHNWRELGRYSSLFRNHGLKPDNYPSETEVFNTLKDAGIEPCFLDVDLDD